MKLQTIDPEICFILIFHTSLWYQFLHHILCLIFQEKCFSCYILPTDQILLSACLYFSRYAVRLKKIVMEFDFLTIFINIATATISQVHSLSSSFNIVFFLSGILLLINWSQSVRGFQSPLLRHPRLDPVCFPLLKIFVSLLLFSVPTPLKVFQTVPPPSCNPLLP